MSFPSSVFRILSKSIFRFMCQAVKYTASGLFFDRSFCLSAGGTEGLS